MDGNPNVSMFGFFLTLVALHSSASALQNSLDASNIKGVKIEPMSGSRIEYDPLPRGNTLFPGMTLRAGFKTNATSGILFAFIDHVYHDVAVSYIKSNHLFFVRQCGKSRAYEVTRRVVNDDLWHQLDYTHTIKGGVLKIDGERHFRQYNMGRCSSFRSIYFGGVPPSTNIRHLTGDTDGFSGCIKKIRMNTKIIKGPPRYYAVSTCV